MTMSGNGNILRNVRMFVTDADGTLIGHRPEFEQYCAFRDRIRKLRSEYGIVWAVSTGRSLRSFNRVFLAMRTFGIVPDFVITSHAYIYEKAWIGYKPHSVWNFRVRLLQFMNWLEIRRAIPRLRRAVVSKNPFTRVVFRNSKRICFRFDDDGAAEFSAGLLKEAVKPYRYLQLFHHFREVDIRSVPFTKGLAVAELARHLRIPAEQILVVGDGHNDISMMQPGVARYTACPRNGVPEVVEVVHQTGGHIAEGRSLTGVMEILDAHEAGQIKSELPAHWQPSRDVANPLALRQMPALSRRKIVMNVVLIAGTLYATMLALAYFGCMPFGRVIAMPFHWLVDLIGRLVHHMMGT